MEDFKFVLTLKKGKKNVDIQGVSMEEFINGETPVISVFINGENDTKEVINFPRDLSVAVNDFESTENEEYTFAKVANKTK